MTQPPMNLHEIMNQAVERELEKPEYVVTSFKLDPRVRDLVHTVCERHCTTMGTFLRECCNQLLREYLPTNQRGN